MPIQSIYPLSPASASSDSSGSSSPTASPKFSLSVNSEWGDEVVSSLMHTASLSLPSPEGRVRGESNKAVTRVAVIEPNRDNLPYFGFSKLSPALYSDAERRFAFLAFCLHHNLSVGGQYLQGKDRASAAISTVAKEDLFPKGHQF